MSKAEETKGPCGKCATCKCADLAGHEEGGTASHRLARMVDELRQADPHPAAAAHLDSTSAAT